MYSLEMGRGSEFFPTFLTFVFFLGFLVLASLGINPLVTIRP